MNNPSKLQSEAVKEFDEFWVILTNRKLVSEKPHTKADIKQFLSDQIQKAVEETRKETIEIIENLKVKHSINPNSPSRERKIIYNEAIRDVINLMEK